MLTLSAADRTLALLDAAVTRAKAAFTAAKTAPVVPGRPAAYLLNVTMRRQELEQAERVRETHRRQMDPEAYAAHEASRDAAAQDAYSHS